MKEMNKYKEEAKRWLNQSIEDLKSAKILLENKRYYLVCFLFQQIVEKALKSILYFNKQDLVIGHSIKKLLDWVLEFNDSLNVLSNKISFLDTYYIPTRYPNSLPDSIPAEVFTENSAKEAYKLADETVNIVKKYLKEKQ